jgi:hypothetical protein
MLSLFLDVLFLFRTLDFDGFFLTTIGGVATTGLAFLLYVSEAINGSVAGVSGS